MSRTEVDGGSAVGRAERNLTVLTLLLVALVAVYVAPLEWHIVPPGGHILGENDLTAHIQIAREYTILQLLTKDPYFLFETLVHLLALVLRSYGAAAVVVVCAAAVATAIEVQRWLIASGVEARLATLCAAATSLAGSPIILLHGQDHLGPPAGYLPLNQWNNPTSTLLLPFAVALLRAVTEIFEGTTPRLSLKGLALLSAVSVLAKPSLAVMLLPALAICLAVSWLRGSLRPGVVKQSVIGIGFPILGVLLIQAYMAARLPAKWHISFAISFFTNFRVAGAETVGFWSAAIILIVIGIIWGSRAVLDRAWSFSALMFVIALMLFCTFIDTGTRRGQVNIGQSLQISAFVWTVATIRVVLGRPNQESSRQRLLLVLVSLVGAAYVAAGLFSWQADLLH